MNFFIDLFLDLRNAFIVVRTDVKSTVVLYSTTAAEKEKWIKEINECISHLPSANEDLKIRSSNSGNISSNASDKSSRGM